MFFRRRQTKDKQVEKETLKESIKQVKLTNQKVPIITLDNAWHQLMEQLKTPEIEELEKQVNELLKEQGKFNTDYIEYERLKKTLLEEILELTTDAFDLASEEAIQKIEEKQKMVLKINEKLETIESRLDALPIEIAKTNAQLADRSVNISYDYINEFKEKSRILDEEIQVIRETLMKKTEEKKAYDQKLKEMYRHLHQLLGPNFIDKLDGLYWEKSE